ncbi:syntaxin-binding protein 5-like isoform X4 [Varroa destructor]|uniref:Syntaxin-binding protein 5-like n=1 Tax=Varroa destructor TaxID=109461 RepID=A0A7M7JPK0_VARDE|nr:syntaxin-binding protein 5-like isoform X4 [Varroa destructor]
MGWRSAELLFFNLVGSEAVVANREQGRDGNEGRRSVLLTTTMSDKESSGGGGGGGGSSSKEKKKEMKRADTKRSGFFKGVLDNLRSSVTQLPSGGKGPGNAGDVQDIPEDKLRKELFNIEKTARHGFPHNPLAVTYDPIQKLVAVGTHSGTIRILGRPGVEITLQHVLDYPVVQLQFIVNEGLLLSLCADDQIHEWNIKNKTPEIVHSLKFQKERITFFHLPFQSKWLYLGTEGGNVHVVNIDTFSLSGYVINWNKAIEISRKTKPGAVVHLSENPVDSNKLLIGFETGTIVLWDLRSRAAEVRFQYNEALSSVSWHFEGKQFMASHGDGSLTTFNIRQPGKPQSVLYPHARTKTLAQGGGGPDPAGSSPGGAAAATASGSPLVVPSSSRNNLLPITKVQWRITRAGDNYVIFSGGLPFEKGNSEVSTLTVSQGRSTTVLEMESPILDFLTLDESPFAFDTQDPFAVVVLLRSDLVVVDLLTHGYPCFRNPYSMDLHESMVICCQYLADCPGELIPCLYSVGARASAQSRHFSEREWPITGGEWGQGIVSYPEVIITGHADGSVRFWDASSLGFQLLYRLKTSRLFEKLKSDDHPFIVEKMSFDPEGRQLAIAGSSYVALFSFAKAEGSCSVTVLDTPIHFEMEEPAPIEVLPRGQVTSGERMVLRPCPQKWAAGLQPTLVCQFLSSGAGGNADSARHVTCMAVSSAYNLLAFGNDSGLVVVDTVHNTCVLNFATPELYEPQPNKSPSSQPISPTQFPPSSLCGHQPTLDPMNPITCRAAETDPASRTGSASGETTPTDRQKVFSKDQKPCVECKTLTKEDRGADKSSTDRGIFKDGKVAEKAEDKPGGSSGANRCRSRRADALRRGTSIQETIADACKKTLQRMLSSPSTRSADPYQRSPRSPKRQDNGLPDPAESSPDQSASVSPTTLKSQRHYLDRRSKSMQTSGGASDSWLSASSHQQLTTMSSLGAHPGRRLLQKHPNLASQDEPPQFLLTASNNIAATSSSDCSFSRSRSSSISSLENVSHEAITCLTFCDTFCSKKGDCSSATPSLWVGTSLGSVLLLPLTLANESRSALASPGSGTLFKLKSPVLCIGFMDSSGAQLVSDGGRLRSVSTSANSHLAVLVSEKLARVVSLPSQNTVIKTNLTDTSFVICADVMQLKSCDVPCLVSYIANGSILIHSLPSLKPVFEDDLQTLVDPKISRIFCLSKNGHGLYMSSPTEFQKFTVSAEFCNQLQELKCTVHTTKEMPEAPKQSFFKGLFGGGPSILDREELFGAAGSGKASKAIARHIPGNAANLEGMKERTGTVAGEVARTRMALDERGQALSQLEERSGRMMNEAEMFASTTSQLMNKYKDKKC